MEQLEYKDGERAGSCGGAWRPLNAVAEHSRGHTDCGITMPSIIIIILGIYNVETPHTDKQTTNFIMRRRRHPALPAESEGADLHI